MIWSALIRTIVAGDSPRGRDGRAADCACQYGVAAAVHAGRTAVRLAGCGVVGHASGGRAVLGDDGRGGGGGRRPGGRDCGPGLRAPQVRRSHPPGAPLQPATLRFAEYVIVFTTFPEPPFSAADVLEWHLIGANLFTPPAPVRLEALEHQFDLPAQAKSHLPGRGRSPGESSLREGGTSGRHVRA